jgi:hypothetical protein
MYSCAVHNFQLILLNTYRYVARRPVRSRLLAVRAERIAAERSGGGGGCTTDDDVMTSELGAGRVPGKFCPRSERRQQLERQRQRRAEELIRTKNLSLGDTAGSAALTAPAAANRRSAEPEPHPAHRQPGPAAALGEAATANIAASPVRNVFNKKGGGGGMTNSPSCGEFQYSRQPVEALAAAAARRQQEPIGASGPVADTNKRYSYHEESYSHVPNDILVSVMTV